MLHIEDHLVKSRILDGSFGLEKESLRVLEDGTLSHTPHPFSDDARIVKDFCENQAEINTKVHNSAGAAIRELESHNRRIYEKLSSLPGREYLWPFSNPPYIQKESDIPVAVFGGIEVSKTAYREYLSAKYGRYKMTFSGIHVNYSFSEELLRADFGLRGGTDFRAYKDGFYLELARKLAAYGWILVAVTAASPLMDSSFFEKGVFGRDVFTGMASVRCGEMGYWNEFTPIFDYRSLRAYADSIRYYVDTGLLKSPSELYYPVRLKPAGENSLESLRCDGVNHIELRMFDVNPLADAGVEEKDVIFAQLLMVWLASVPDWLFLEKDQIQAVQNFKNAAHYDLKTVNILTPDGKMESVARAARNVIDRMRAFYDGLPADVDAVLQFEYEKFTDADNRYAWKIRKQFADGYVSKGLRLAAERQGKSDV